MASGNFLIGNGLSYDGFREYVLPVFEKSGLTIPNSISIPSSYIGRVFTSIIGDKEEGLDSVVNQLLVNCGLVLDNLHKESSSSLSVYSMHVMGLESGSRNNKGIYEVVGIYESDEMASELFPVIAQSYLIDVLGKKVGEVNEKIKRMLETKLGELK